jgi:hypothetical protein
LRGVISVDLSLQTLTEFIDQEPLSPNSYSYIFDLAGNNIVHPNVDLNTSSTDEIRQPITQLETDDPRFQEMILLAQIDQKSTQIISYDNGDNIVSLTPIGNTSMILGMTTPLYDLVPDDVEAKLSLLSINTLAFLPGIGFGIIGAMVILLMRHRLTRADTNVPTQSEVIQKLKEENS